MSDDDCTDTDGMSAMGKIQALADCMGDGDEEGSKTLGDE